jgi:hypothetical protein
LQLKINFGQVSASFLKKRSKKLLSIGFAIACGVRHADGVGTPEANTNQVLQVFCFFFSKKKRLPSLYQAMP